MLTQEEMLVFLFGAVMKKPGTRLAVIETEEGKPETFRVFRKLYRALPETDRPKMFYTSRFQMEFEGTGGFIQVATVHEVKGRTLDGVLITAKANEALSEFGLQSINEQLAPGGTLLIQTGSITVAYVDTMNQSAAYFAQSRQ